MRPLPAPVTTSFPLAADGSEAADSFVPMSAVLLLLGCANYVWTLAQDGRLTNGSTLLWSAAVIVFLIGLVSEQITALTYRRDA